jgi:enoyl-CoA hydratase
MDQAVLAWREQRVGRIRLNRPAVLNALDLNMVRLIRAALDDFRADPAIHAVMIDAAGERAFCAGGDIRAIRAHGMAGETAETQEFFTAEYALNQAIADYPKPYVALIDGTCLGGGIGVSVHGSHRIATENAMFAMPETGIGLFPDIGASFFLPRLPGKLGLYLGLTGTRMKGADAVHAGLATHFCPRAAG